MRALRRTWWAAWQEARANRTAFWTQIVIMVVNDTVWILFWLLFFGRVGDIRGWGLDELILLFAVLTTAGGIVLGLLNNTRRVGELVVNGGLDSVLALPTAPLPYSLSRRVEIVNVGDLVFGVVLFVAFGHPTPTRAVIYVFGVLCASMIMGGFLVLMGSTSFFVSRNEGADLGFHAIMLFSSYPADIFGGATQVFLYAVVPAGFVSTVPAKLISDFSLAWASATFGVALRSGPPPDQVRWSQASRSGEASLPARS